MKRAWHGPHKHEKSLIDIKLVHFAGELTATSDRYYRFSVDVINHRFYDTNFNS
jgi:hypothetical protein